MRDAGAGTGVRATPHTCGLAQEKTENNMALIDFLAKALETATDIAASSAAQRTMEEGYKRGKVSQADYDRYHNALRDYKRKKGMDDDD